MKSKAPSIEANNFDIIRLLLALLVVFSHSYPLGLGSEIQEPFTRLTNGQTTGGAIAVSGFFIMSGYLITASFLRSASCLDYLGKRIRRIYPGFMVAMLFAALIVVPISGGVLTGGSPTSQIANFLGNVLRLQEFRYVGAFAQNPYPNAIDGSVWTVSYEFWCYVGIMLLGMGGLLVQKKFIAVLFTTSFLVGVAFNVFHLRIYGSVLGLIFGQPGSWAHFLPLFLAGTTAFLFRHRIRYSGRGAWCASLILLSACFIPCAFETVFPFAGAYLLFWFAFNKSFRPTHHLLKVGDLSYGTYLYAFPVQQIIVNSWGKTMNPLLLFLAATPLILSLAFASWHLVEAPLLKMKPRRESKLPVGEVNTLPAVTQSTT